MTSRDAEVYAIQSAQKTIMENVDNLRGQRAELVTDISKMHDEVLTLSRRMEQSRTQIERDVTQAQAEKTQLRQEIEIHKQEIERLKSNINGLEPIKRHLESSITDRQQHLSRLENRLDDCRNVASEYTTQIEQAKTLWNEVVRRTQEETKNLETAKSQAEKLEPAKLEMENLASKLEKLRREHFEAQNNVESLRANESELRAGVAAFSAIMESSKQKEIELMKAQHQADLQLAKTKLEHDSLGARNTEFKRDSESYQQKIGELSAKKTLLEQDIIEAQGRLRHYEAALEPLRDLAQQRESEIRRLESEINSGRNNLREITQQIDEREKRIDSISKRHEDLLIENRRLESIISNLARQENQSRELLAKMQSESAKMEVELTSTRFALGEITEEVLRKRTLNERFINENNSLQEVLNHTQTELTKTRHERTEALHELDKAQESRIAIEMERNGLAKQSQKLTESLDSLKRDIAERTQHRDLLLSEETHLSATALSFKESIERTQSELSELQNRRQEFETQVIKLEGDASTLRNEVDSLKNQQAELGVVQIRLRDLIKKEELTKQAITLGSRTEKAIEDRTAKLEQQEEEILKRIDSFRAKLIETGQMQQELAVNNSSENAKLQNVRSECSDLSKKRDSLAAIIERDTAALITARENLREIEELKKIKLKEIELMRNQTAPQTIHTDSPTEGASQAPASSAQVRADAEKTLETLRKHLDGVVSKRDPSKS